MLEQASVEEMFQKYGEMLYKICIVMLENTYDAEDTVQDVLIKYMTKKPLFETYEHEKAWLIRVTINLCKDKLRFYKQHPYINIETIKTTYPEDSIDNQILAILLELPSKYKEVLLFHFVTAPFTAYINIIFYVRINVKNTRSKTSESKKCQKLRKIIVNKWLTIFTIYGNIQVN